MFKSLESDCDSLFSLLKLSSNFGAKSTSVKKIETVVLNVFYFDTLLKITNNQEVISLAIFTYDRFFAVIFLVSHVLITNKSCIAIPVAIRTRISDVDASSG